MEELSTLREELRKCGEALIKIASRLSTSPEEKAPSIEEKAPSLEDVRAVLAEKARDGLTPQVRELLKKYGADKLSAVHPEDYRALMKDVEGITNA